MRVWWTWPRPSETRAAKYCYHFAVTKRNVSHADLTSVDYSFVDSHTHTHDSADASFESEMFRLIHNGKLENLIRIGFIYGLRQWHWHVTWVFRYSFYYLYITYGWMLNGSRVVAATVRTTKWCQSQSAFQTDEQSYRTIIRILLKWCSKATRTNNEIRFGFRSVLCCHLIVIAIIFLPFSHSWQYECEIKIVCRFWMRRAEIEETQKSLRKQIFLIFFYLFLVSWQLPSNTIRTNKQILFEQRAVDNFTTL